MGLKTIQAAGGLVLNEKQEILMIFRRGKWDLPKGKLDEGEKIEECAVREVMEETGLTKIDLGALLSITHHTYFDTWLKEEVIKETYWFRMDASSQQELIPQKEEDIQDIKWISADQLEIYLSNSYDNIKIVIHSKL
jgi:8-oxo-dGTP pyrophosphatase MutT (NUDIX family)